MEFELINISEIITRSIINSYNQELRQYIGASSIGNKCNRAIWYGFVGEKQSELKPELMTAFDVGKRLESLILDYMDFSNLNVVRPTKNNNYLFFQDSDVLEFQGHADGILILPGGERAIVEIKTAKSSSFAKFKSKGLRLWQEQYFSQLQSYLGMSKYSKGVLIAINKDSSEIHHEWVEYDDIYYSELKTKASSIAKSKEPPDRINKSPLFYTCNMCCYKEICHK